VLRSLVMHTHLVRAQHDQSKLSRHIVHPMPHFFAHTPISPTGVKT
jgi:hypothetical protein